MSTCGLISSLFMTTFLLAIGATASAQQAAGANPRASHGGVGAGPEPISFRNIWVRELP